jgi:hypothetical protein
VAAGLQHAPPPSSAWATDAGSLGSDLGTRAEGTGLTLQLDQTGGQVSTAALLTEEALGYGQDEADLDDKP